MNRTRLLPFAALIALTGLALPTAALAASYRSGDTVIAKGQTLNDDLYVSGGTLTVDGTVDGDIVAAGGTIIINGTVKGDVMAAGGSIELRGKVGDDVRMAGGQLSVYGSVGDDVMAAGSSIDLKPGSSVGGDTRLAANEITLAGTAHSVNVAGNQITVASTAKLSDLHYASQDQASIAGGSKISGSVTRTDWPKKQGGARLIIPLLLALLGTILFAGLLGLFAPRYVRHATDSVSLSAGRSIGYGLLAFIGLPLAAILLIASGIGTLPGIYLALALPLFFYISYLVAVLAVGRWLSARLLGPRERIPWIWGLLGAVLLEALLAVPAVGVAAAFIAILYGAGKLVKDRPEQA